MVLHAEIESENTPKVHSRMHEIEIEGRVALFVSGMPEEFVTAAGGGLAGGMKTFMYGWIDSERGASGRVSFPAGGNHTSSRKTPESAELKTRSVDEKGAGTFKMSLSLRDGDPKYLKLQASVRARDPESKNKRNFNVAVSCADLSRMLAGREEAFTMADQFTPGNYVDVKMWVTNAQDFRNHLSCLEDTEKPLITFGSSALDRITDWNAIVSRTSNNLVQNLKKIAISNTPGCDGFRDGVTW